MHLSRKRERGKKESLTSTTIACVASRSFAGSVRNTAFGVPAAARSRRTPTDRDRYSGKRRVMAERRNAADA